jgi:hypothetical protein
MPRMPDAAAHTGSNTNEWAKAVENSESHPVNELVNPQESDVDGTEEDDIYPKRHVPEEGHEPPISHGSLFDTYGRLRRNPFRSGSHFTGILPDNPFGIACGPFLSGLKDHSRTMPILQFWTWTIKLSIKIPDSSEKGTEEDGLCRCSIVDKRGDWCGSIVVQQSWAAVRQGSPLTFIAVSDANSFTKKECPAWNYYIPKERDESEWDLYFVLLLQRNRGRACWERMALGKVFQAAFLGEASWEEIKLG